MAETKEIWSSTPDENGNTTKLYQFPDGSYTLKAEDKHSYTESEVDRRDLKLLFFALERHFPELRNV